MTATDQPTILERRALLKLASGGALAVAVSGTASAQTAPTTAPASPPTTGPRQAWAHVDRRVDLKTLDAAPVVDPATFLAIQGTFARFGIAHDEGREAPLLSLFTPDAVLEVAEASGTPFQTVRGRKAIVANFLNVFGQQKDQRRHAMTNLVIEALNGNSATALCYGIVTVANGALLIGATVFYSADLRRDTGGRWRFARFFIGMDAYTTPKPVVKG